MLHGRAGEERRFEQWCEMVAALPRRQTRVLTWPVVTVFAFIAQPDRHVFLKPNVTRVAAGEYGFDFAYRRGRTGRRTRACSSSRRASYAISATSGRAT